MTRKLEELFNLPAADADTTENSDAEPSIADKQHFITEIDSAIDRIDAALPTVRDLNASDAEMDEIAKRATETFDDLMSLGMNVDSRFAAEIFGVAGTMLGHALSAKTAKLNKKLKMIDLQLKKARLDQTAGSGEEAGPAVQHASGHVLDRNELLEKLLGDRVSAKKE
jgi:hypothetical protein